jgi:hypothetical protein
MARIIQCFIPRSATRACAPVTRASNANPPLGFFIPHRGRGGVRSMFRPPMEAGVPVKPLPKKEDIL